MHSLGLLRGIVSGALITIGAASAPTMAQVNSPYDQSPALMRPGLTQPGQATVAEDAAVIDIPLRWAESVRITRTVVVPSGDEEPLELAAGSLLSRVLIGGEAGGVPQRKVYCSRYNGIAVEMPRAALFPGGLLLRGYESLIDGQTCLEDPDGDGLMEQAVLLGEGNTPREAGAIDPVPFTMLAFEPINPQTDSLRITLRSVSAEHVRLVVNFVQNGVRQDFDELGSGPYRTDQIVTLVMPGTREGASSVNIFGVRVDLQSVDRRANTAVFSWQAEAAEDEVVVVPTRVSVSSR